MKKGLLKICAVILSVAVSICIAWIVIVTVNRPGTSFPDTRNWQTGDIFFSIGDSWKSVVVRSFTSIKDFDLHDSTPSHCGIVLRNGDKLRLVHASTDAKRIVAETPEEYYRKNGSHCIFTMKSPAAVDTSALRSAAEQLVRIRKPFDFNFDHTDSTSFYCSEMVVWLLERTGYPEISRLRSLYPIYPQDIRLLLSGAQ